MITRPKLIRPISASVLILFLLVGGYLGYLQLSGNFHTVVAGELYRSAQITPDRLATYQQHYGIRTVINLRGENAGSEWYDKEVDAARDLDISHIDFRMSANQRLSKGRAAELLDVLRKAPKPILIHCRRGADRSGLAAALYVAAVVWRDEDQAERQLSARYGHIGLPYLSAAYAMDETWEELEPWLGFRPASAATQLPRPQPGSKSLDGL